MWDGSIAAHNPRLALKHWLSFIHLEIVNGFITLSLIMNFRQLYRTACLYNGSCCVSSLTFVSGSCLLSLELA